MTHRAEVKILTRGPAEGTRHRGDKGTFGRVPGALGAPEDGYFTARACPMEVVGELTQRTEVKRRKAFATGEPASSGKTPYPWESRAYWRRGGSEVCEPYSERSVGIRASGRP